MEKLSNNFKKSFLLYFTRELILHSSTGEVLHLQNLMKGQIKEGKEEFIRSIKKKIPEKKEELKKEDLDFYKVFKKMQPKQTPIPQRRVLIIPEPKLPPHLQYLKPVAREVNIDLERLNPLIKDPAVKVIECNGPDEHIFVRGTMGAKPTKTVLSKEEIDKIIKKFSELSRIPMNEGVYRVVVGRLILSAIISDVVGSKFMIKKMFYSPHFQGQTYPQSRKRQFR